MEEVKPFVRFVFRSDFSLKAMSFNDRITGPYVIDMRMDRDEARKIWKERDWWRYKDGKLSKRSTTAYSKIQKRKTRDKEIRDAYFKEKQIQLQNLYAIETDDTRTLEERTLAHIQREALEKKLRNPIQVELLQRLHDDPDTHDWYHARLTERGWLVNEVVTIP